MHPTDAGPAAYLSNFTFNSTQAPYVISPDSPDFQPAVVLDSNAAEPNTAVRFMELASFNSTEQSGASREQSSPSLLESCSRLPELGRYESGTTAFQAKFFLRVMEVPLVNRLSISDKEIIVMKFDLRQNKDIGGTLHFDITLENYLLVSDQNTSTSCCDIAMKLPSTAVLFASCKKVEQ